MQVAGVVASIDPILAAQCDTPSCAPLRTRAGRGPSGGSQAFKLFWLTRSVSASRRSMGYMLEGSASVDAGPLSVTARLAALAR